MAKIKATMNVIDRDRGYAAFQRQMRHVAKTRPHVKLGVLGNGGDVALIALVHEFGSPDRGIPERSWLRSAVDRHDGWSPLRKKLLKQVIDGKLTAEQALGLLGLQAVADIKAGIVAHIPPPLKPATIAAKGSSTPLIDSGRFMGSITSSVGHAGEDSDDER